MPHPILKLLVNPGRLLKNVRYRWTQRISTEPYIFVVGVPRSGTTLLKTLLVAHSEIGGTDYESSGIFGVRDIFQYAMGDLDSACIQDLLRTSADIVEFYDHQSSRLLAQSGNSFFVDKLQIKKYRLDFVVKHFPNAMFLHIVRDGRDCYCSALTHPNVLQSASIESFAKYWLASQRVIAKSIPDALVYTLRYEDLTSEITEEMVAVMDFLGVPFEKNQIDSAVFSKTTSIKKRHVHRNLALPVNTRSVRRWERELTEEENREFTRIASSGLLSYGYEL